MQWCLLRRWHPSICPSLVVGFAWHALKARTLFMQMTRNSDGMACDAMRVYLHQEESRSGQIGGTSEWNWPYARLGKSRLVAFCMASRANANAKAHSPDGSGKLLAIRVNLLPRSLSRSFHDPCRTHPSKQTNKQRNVKGKLIEPDRSIDETQSEHGSSVHPSSQEVLASDGCPTQRKAKLVMAHHTPRREMWIFSLLLVLVLFFFFFASKHWTNMFLGHWLWARCREREKERQDELRAGPGWTADGEGQEEGDGEERRRGQFGERKRPGRGCLALAQQLLGRKGENVACKREE